MSITSIVTELLGSDEEIDIVEGEDAGLGHSRDGERIQRCRFRHADQWRQDHKGDEDAADGPQQRRVADEPDEDVAPCALDQLPGHDDRGNEATIFTVY